MKNRMLIIIEGLAIILVLISHSYYYPEVINYSAVIGVFLFGFSSGFKLVYNHINELNDRVFLRKYAFKRFKRLLKPYIGYTILVLPIMCALLLESNGNTYLSNFGQFNILKNSTLIDLVYKFGIGNNPIVVPTWFLYSLCIVTSICLAVLYASDIKVIFAFFPIIIIVSLYHDLPSTLEIGIAFILGMLFAYYNVFSMSIIYLLAIFCILFFYFDTYLYGENIFIRMIFMLTIPSLAFVVYKVVDNIKYINRFVYLCGIYSFYIYLLHAPFVEPAMYLLLRFFSISNNVQVFVQIPIIVVVTILLYKILSSVGLNRFFE